MFIKKTVQAFNFKKDFNVGRRKSCGFVEVYLKHTFFHGKSYELAKPFKENDFFNSTSSRRLIIKVLLYPHDLAEQCNLCLRDIKHTYQNYIHECPCLLK